MLALARKGPEGQLSISEIAEMEGLSVPYASKLLAILRKAGLVTAVRGRGGGFCIERPAAEISLLRCMTALGGPLIDPDHCQKFTGQLEECVHADDCSVHHVLDSLAAFIADILGRTTLEDLVNRAGEQRIHEPGLVSADALINGMTAGPATNEEDNENDNTQSTM